MARCAPSPGLRLDAAELDAMFRAFAEPTRLRILHLLRERSCCVSDLVQILRVPQPKVSRHLGRLRAAGLVEAERRGTWAFYALSGARHDLHARLLDCVSACFQGVPELRADLERARGLAADGALHRVPERTGPGSSRS